MIITEDIDDGAENKLNSRSNINDAVVVLCLMNDNDDVEENYQAKCLKTFFLARIKCSHLTRCNIVHSRRPNIS